MSSSSDSDDCQLYTRTADRIAIQRKLLEEDRRDLALHMKYLPDDEVQGYSEKFDKMYDFDVPAPSTFIEPIECQVLSSTDSEDDVPLTQLKTRLKLKRKHIKQRFSVRAAHKKSKKKSQPSNRGASDNSDLASSSGTAPKDTNEIPTIVFDDDTGYPSSESFAPIQFNSRPNPNKKITETEDIDLDAPLQASYDDKDFEEDLDTPVKISIDWRNNSGILGIVKHFQLRRYQKFETVFEELAKLEGVPINRVAILRNFETIRPRDTPASLNLTYYGHLIGQISDTDIDHSLPKLSELDDDNKKPPEGEIKVKLLLDSKASLSIKLSKNQKMNILYKKCSEELNIPDEKIKISFDGEIVQQEDTVSDLGVEDGDAFDVLIKKGKFTIRAYVSL